MISRDMEARFTERPGFHGCVREMDPGAGLVGPIYFFTEHSRGPRSGILFTRLRSTRLVSVG